MKSNTKIELGYIVDNLGNKWDAYAEHLTFTGKGEDVEVVIEGIELEREYPQGCSQTLSAPSLSEMPDRFSQAQCNALESWVLEQHRIEQQAYLQDMYVDAQRGCE